MDGFYSFLFYGLIAVGAVLIISLTVLRIDWARHPEKYEKDVENYEKEQYWRKKKQDKEPGSLPQLSPGTTARSAGSFKGSRS